MKAFTLSAERKIFAPPALKWNNVGRCLKSFAQVDAAKGVAN